MRGKTCNLILINRPPAQDRHDFEEIAEEILRIAPEIDTHVVDFRDTAETLPPEVWTRPTLIVAFTGLGNFRPRRGLVYACRPINKLTQLAKFAAAGISVPLSAAYKFGRPLDPAFWGEHVILKSTALGTMSSGRSVFLVRTERIAAMAERLFPPEHPARRAPLLVQRFIDTGAHPMSYRVLVLFGQPLLSIAYRLRGPRPPLTASDEELLNSPVASNTASLYSHELVDVPDVLDFASRAWGAMPAIPLQGMDVIREEKTGRLYVLENNGGGNTWHFSSKISEDGRKEISRERRIAQFGAWRLAARALAERTLREAG